MLYVRIILEKTTGESMNAKEKILQAAVQILIEEGPQGFSIRKVTGLAGVNHGLVPHYFGDKEGLILEMIVFRTAQVDQPLDEEVQSPEALRELLLERVLGSEELSRFLGMVVILSKEYDSVASLMARITERRRRQFMRALGIDQEGATLLQTGIMGLVLQRSLEPDLDLRPLFGRLLDCLLVDKD